MGTLQVQAQREALRHQTSKKLLLGNETAADGTVVPWNADTPIVGLDAAEYEDLAALAGRLAAQQEEIKHLSSQLVAANSKRAELVKASGLRAYCWQHGT